MVFSWGGAQTAIRAPQFKRPLEGLAVNNTISISPLFKHVKPTGFYVYVHARATDGRPFYVGKGFGKRAWDRTKSEWRNDHWINTARKNGVNVSIIKDGMTEADALSLEMTTIAEIKNNGGCLVNQTNGGEGTSGRIVSPETREMMSAKLGKGVHCSNGMSFNSHNKAAAWLSTHLGRTVSGAAIGKAARGQSHVAYGFSWWRWCDEPKDHKIQLENLRYRIGRNVSTDCGLDFRAIGDAISFLRNNGFPKASIKNVWMAATGRADTAYGYRWKYAGYDTSTEKQRRDKVKKLNPKSITIFDDSGTEYKSARAAAAAIRSNGYPTADHKAILNAARSGDVMFGTKWAIRNMENTNGYE